MAAAQDDRGYLQGLIEDNLSGAGREVRITGFAGALSSRATLEELTIADSQGIWLTLRGATLDWSRSALLGGQLEINTLSAETLIVPRLPVSENTATLPSAEATGFSLPELPVSIRIGTLSIGRAELGAALFGEDAAISLDGSLSLEAGAGKAAVQIVRLDGKTGTLTLDGAFANATQDLALDLTLNEQADGIAANLLNLPGRPSLDLSVDGSGNMADFTADIKLDTDGATRLAGVVTLTAESQDSGPPLRRFSANIGGDLAPVFTPEYQPFFGDTIQLVATGARDPGGALVLDQLSLTADSLTLQGRAELAADGLPVKLALTGQIANPKGGAVLLPLGSTPVEVARVDLDVRFDAALGDTWRATIGLVGLGTAELKADSLTLTGTGLITTDASAGNRITADLDFQGQGLDLGSADLTEALGTTINGATRIDWRQGNPVTIAALTLTGAGVDLNGSGTLDIERRDLAVTGTIAADIANLIPFSGLAGRNLAGAARAQITGSGALLGGDFAVNLTASTQDLQLSIPQADPLLRGQGTVELTAFRDGTGLTIQRLAVQNPELTGALSGKLQTDGSRLQANARLRDVALIVPQLSGAVTLTAQAAEADGIWTIKSEATAPGDSKLSVDGLLSDIMATPTFDGEIKADVGNLRAFSGLAGRNLNGSALARITGAATLSGETFRLDLSAITRDLAVDIPQADALLKGQGTLDLVAMRTATGLQVQRLAINTPALTASGSGSLQDVGSILQLTADLTDSSLIYPQMSGPLSVHAGAQDQGGMWQVEAKARGPGSSDITIEGQLSDPLAKPAFDGTLSVAAIDLRPYSGIAGRALSGAIQLQATGKVDTADASYALDLTGTSSNLRVGQPEADKLLAGSARYEASIAGTGTRIGVKRLILDTPQLAANLKGDTDGDAINLDLDIRLANLGLLAPGIDGPLQTTGTARQVNGRWSLDLAANGPAGSQAKVSGNISADFAQANLNLTGQAPLALANRFITPNSVTGTASFDLRLDGRPSLAALSGTVTVGQARAVLPGSNIVLDSIGANIALQGASANVSANASVQGGGRITLDGPVALDAPYSANMVIRLANVTVTDPNLYKTSVTGELTATGPLAGGAALAGTLNLGRTEVQIPSTGLGALGDIPGIVHLNEPAAVRATRERAGLLATKSGGGGTGARYPIDVQIIAANQIFIRGRGLDAELGGVLRLTGTTADLIPSGQFDLVRGRLDILGKRLVLDEGLARLQGDFLPYIRLVASTASDTVRILITIEGEASDPQIIFSSQPELPEDEVLARLLFGRGTDQISPLQAAQLASAVATLAGQGGVGIIARLREGFGLDDLDVTSDEEGNAALRAGKYLGENLYTDVTVGATSSEINLNLDISSSITAKGTVNSTGETSLGIFFQRDY